MTHFRQKKKMETVNLEALLAINFDVCTDWYIVIKSFHLNQSTRLYVLFAVFRRFVQLSNSSQCSDFNNRINCQYNCDQFEWNKHDMDCRKAEIEKLAVGIVCSTYINK